MAKRQRLDSTDWRLRRGHSAAKGIAGWGVEVVVPTQD